MVFGARVCAAAAWAGSVKAVIAALPREVNGLVRGWDRREVGAKVFVYRRGRNVVACAGMGSARVALAVQAALAEGGVTELISAGIAGACDPALKVGDVVRAGTVVDVRTGERFGAGGDVIVTVPEIAGVSEKRRLSESYGAGAVEMEAAAVARLAQAHGLGFGAIKVISDESDFEMEGLGDFATAEGQFREAVFALHALVRPRSWAKLMALARNGNMALEVLTRVLAAELADEGI